MLYSIGDVHGRYDLLRYLHEKIMEHSKQFDEVHTIVMLGDYIDRGPDSKQVIDFLITEPFTDFKHVYLKGNHEDMMIKSLYSDEETVIYDVYKQDMYNARNIFLGNGGTTTLESFGVEYIRLMNDKESLDHVFLPYLPFFMGLEYYYDVNGYYFVHAGIVPGVPLDQQDPNAVLWIRDRFLNNTDDHGRLIIHGHTPTTTRGMGAHPEVKPNRINIDTCAYRTGILTAVCLDEAHLRVPEFISTE